MNGIFGTCAVLMFLVVTPFALAQNPPTTLSLRLEVTISVHDYVDVPPSLLVPAEAQASRIFRNAGLDTVWLNCGPKLESVEPKACYLTDTTHLTLKILPQALSAQFRDRYDVLGTALLDGKGIGYYAYAFYDRIRQLANERHLGYALLGGVLAHEIGHLLLGSNSHSVSGIMCAHWKYEEVLKISEGTITFAPPQSRIMQDRLRLRQNERMDLTSVVTGPKISASPITTVRSSDAGEFQDPR